MKILWRHIGLQIGIMLLGLDPVTVSNMLRDSYWKAILPHGATLMSVTGFDEKKVFDKMTALFLGK